MNGIVKMIAPIMALGTIAVALATPSMAQDHPMGVNARLHRQDARIDQGVRNHDLNKYQARRLHAVDRSIHHVEMRDRRHDNGHLTAAERTRLEHRLNRDNKAIYGDKHHDR